MTAYSISLLFSGLGRSPLRRAGIRIQLDLYFLLFLASQAALEEG
jgi:hypothetical protein